MKHSASRITVSTALLAFSFFCPAHAATTIADWTFEGSQINTVVSTNSSILLPAIGPSGSMAWGHHAAANSSFGGVTGNGSSTALTANHWAVGDFFEFQTSTLAFTNISVLFDQYRSDTGPTNWDFEYSVDGTHFTTALTYSVTNAPSWTASTCRSAFTFTIDLTHVTALSEEDNVFFRLVADSAPSSALGASRVDNFLALGKPAPEPATSILIGAGVCLLLFVRRQHRQ